MGKRIEVEILGHKFNSLREACKFFGISVQLVSLRMKKGMNIEEALTIKPGRKVYYKKRMNK